MVQPSKVLSLLPRPSGNQGLVLSHLATMDEKHSNPIASEPGMNPVSQLISASSCIFITPRIAQNLKIAIKNCSWKQL